LPVLFPYENAVNYHIYYDVLNAKQHGIPQNRERVFIIGIRDDIDNDFRFPKTEYLTKRLIDVLEKNVADKFFLSEKMIQYLEERNQQGFGKGKLKYKDGQDTAFCITKSSSSLDICDNIIRLGNVHPSGNGMNGEVFDSNRISPTLSTNKGEGIKIKTNNALGHEIAQHGDAICYENLNSKTRRGRVGNQVAQTLDTQAQQAVLLQENKQSHNGYAIRRLTPRECFRLMDFPDSFDFSVVSDTQAYKQAGNSIVVRVLEKIIGNLPL
jgi:DNA (cytosine-5)-methyltransferase 1